MTIGIKYFDLNTPMHHFEYMKIAVSLIPTAIFEAYQITNLVHNGYVYVEIQKGMYRLPQAGCIANDVLIPYLAKHGYHQLEHTPGLFKHKSKPVIFSLVVDNFGVKVVGQIHADHLINCLKQHYDLTIDPDGKIFCGIHLLWDYKKHTVDLSMPNYVAKALA